MSTPTLASLIEKTIAEFFPKSGAMGATMGGCGDFADYLYHEALEHGIELEFESVYGTLDESDCVFTAPVGTTLDQLHQWGVIKNLSHVWLIYEGRHYDGITPDGANDPFELRFFRQVCVEVLARDYPETLNELKAKHVWWRESVLLTDEFIKWSETRPTDEEEVDHVY
jgi:hypothetical protein